MKKKTVTGMLSLWLCFLLFLPAALSEIRQEVIALEGEVESIEETFFESPLGFSFWYANDRLEADYDEADNIDGVVVRTLYSDDYMVLTMIPEDEAEEYMEVRGEPTAVPSEMSRSQTDLYRVLDNGTYYFCTLISENGHYLRAVGQYYEDAAEGNAKFFDKVLDSVSFTSDDSELLTDENASLG